MKTAQNIENIERVFLYKLIDGAHPGDVPVLFENCQPLKPEMFLNDECAKVYACVCSMIKDNVEITKFTVAEIGENKGFFGKGEGYQIINHTVFAGGQLEKFEDSVLNSVKTYAEMIRNAHHMRVLEKCAEQIKTDVTAPAGRNASEILSGQISMLTKLADQFTGSTDEQIENVGDVVLSTFAALADKNKNIIKSGFPALDEVTGGFRPGQLVLIAARPGMGKSALGMNIAYNIATSYGTYEKPVIVFSLEMPEIEIGARMMCSSLKIRMSELTGEYPKIDATNKLINGAPEVLSKLTDGSNERWRMHLCFKNSITPSELSLECQKIARKFGGVSAVLIDYVQYMRPDHRADNRNIEVAEISHALKSLAKQLKAPVIALSQLNRSIDGRSGHTPVNSDLRDSGALEQDADMIMFIVREDAYAKDANEEQKESNEAQIHVTKNRNGRTGCVRLGFNGAECRFYDLNIERADDMAGFYGQGA